MKKSLQQPASSSPTVAIGYIIREHGVHGECKMAPLPGGESSLKRGVSCTLVKGNHRTLAKILQLHPGSKDLIGHFDIFTAPEQIIAWRGATIEIARDKRLRPSINYIFDDEWVGLQVFNGSDQVGEVLRVIYTPLKQLVVRVADEREILIPCVTEWISKMDTAAKKLWMHLPEGLIDL